MLNKNKLKELMKDSYVKNIRELSNKTRVPYSTLNRMMQGYDMHVSSIIELSKFFEVPMDAMISKSYGIMSYTQDREIYFECTNIMEVTLEIMLETIYYNLLWT